MRVLTVRDLAALIRDRRQKLGLDQKALAERVGVSRYWIIGIESGKAGAEVGLVLRTLRALGLTLEVTDDRSQSRGDRKATTARPSADDLVKAALERRK